MTAREAAFAEIIKKFESLSVLRKMWSAQEIIAIIRDLEKEPPP